MLKERILKKSILGSGNLIIKNIGLFREKNFKKPRIFFKLVTRL